MLLCKLLAISVNRYHILMFNNYINCVTVAIIANTQVATYQMCNFDYNTCYCGYTQYVAYHFSYALMTSETATYFLEQCMLVKL